MRLYSKFEIQLAGIPRMSNKLIRIYEHEHPSQPITIAWENIQQFNTAETAIGDGGGGYSDPSRGPSYSEPDRQKIGAQTKYTSRAKQAAKYASDRTWMDMHDAVDQVAEEINQLVGHLRADEIIDLFNKLNLTELN